jgi:amino acid permease
VRTGLVPSKISALGLEFSQTDQKSLLSILALITLYFVAAFILYASSDFVAWRLAFVEALKQWATQKKWEDFWSESSVVTKLNMGLIGSSDSRN